MEETLREQKEEVVYVTMKLNIITLSSHPGTKTVNKQGATCYLPEDADLRPFLSPTYLFCMIAHNLQEARRVRLAGPIRHGRQQNDSRPDPKPIPRY